MRRNPTFRSPDPRRRPWHALRLTAFVLAAVFVTGFLTGCGGAEDDLAERPSGEAGLSDSLLIEILADIHLVDARRYLGIREDSTAVVESESGPDAASGAAAAAADGSDQQDDVLARLRSEDPPVDSVLHGHGATREEYDAALRWYVDHPDQFVNLYNRVLDRLNQAR